MGKSLTAGKWGVSSCRFQECRSLNIPSGGKKTSTAFFVKAGALGWWSISTMWSWPEDISQFGHETASVTDMTAHLGTRRCPYCEGEQLAIHRRAIQPDLRKARRVPLNGLTDTPVPGIQLNASLDLEASSNCVRGNSNKRCPLFVSRNAIVDDLVVGQGDMSVKDLDWCVGSSCGSRSGPMVHRSVGDDSEGLRRCPLPEDDILVHQMRLDFLLQLDVENLQLSSGCILPRRRKTSSAGRPSVRQGIMLTSKG